MQDCISSERASTPPSSIRLEPDRVVAPDVYNTIFDEDKVVQEKFFGNVNFVYGHYSSATVLTTCPEQAAVACIKDPPQPELRRCHVSKFEVRKVVTQE